VTRLGVRVLGVAVGAVTMLGVGATAASAGEIGGSGRYTPVNPEFNRGVAASECAFSGLNDEYVLGVPGDWSRVQNYPHARAELAELWIELPKGMPGLVCNPTGKRIPG
jgi:hypothetical protein